MVARARSGRSSLGCLVVLLLLTAAGYFAVNIGEAYWRFYQFQDAMKQEARFAGRRTDEAIALRLRAKGDSLGVPDEAIRRLRVRRAGRQLRITSDYVESIELPLVVRQIRFTPHAEGAF